MANPSDDAIELVALLLFQALLHRAGYTPEVEKGIRRRLSEMIKQRTQPVKVDFYGNTY